MGTPIGAITHSITTPIVFVYFSQLEPFMFCLYLMDQRFHSTTNKSSKFTLLKHAQLDINLASMQKASY
jgi:hypothetical protein